MFGTDSQSDLDGSDRHVKPEYDEVFSLGLGLIELSFQRSFQVLCQQYSDMSQVDDKDCYFSTAKRCIGDIIIISGPKYAEAVCNCMGIYMDSKGVPGTQDFNRSLENPAFKSQVYANVIQILEDNHKVYPPFSPNPLLQ
jgi:hypothetical protein